MSNIATREAYGKALLEVGELNQNVVVLDADLSKSTKTADFKAKYPERFFNMGIAEQNLMGAAAGLSTVGKIPFASTFAVFATGRAFEIIRNSIAYPKLNVKVCATHAGITVGEDGASHQSIEDISLMRTLPNMTVIVPADGIEARQAILEVAKYNGPVYVRLGRLATPIVNDDNYKFEIGKAKTLKDGSDVSIIACGVMVEKALEAARILEEQGITAKVINMSTIKPLDKDAIVEAAKDTNAIVTAEEHSVIGGLFSAVSETVVSNNLVPVVPVAINDTFGESGKPAELMEKYGLTAEKIVEAAKTAISKK
ncbi:MAG: transketolase family protein [Peptostreptococcaceae bacterium]|jgi:transketolase|nr:transketolase family protein [Peptostreptococcaceae bacterium]